MEPVSEAAELPCSLCNENELSVTCKVCINNYCSNCTSNNIEVYACPDGRGNYDVCKHCMIRLENIKAIISRDSISWSKMTLRGENWMKSSGAWDYMNSQEGDINTYSTVAVSPDDEEGVKKDIMTGRTDPDTFIWEIHETLKRVMNESYKEDLSKVLKAYCARNGNIGYCQGLNYVCTWLLLFLDTNRAFWMLCYLIEKWLLPDFYIGAKHGNSLNGFYIESTVIAGLLDHLVPAIKTSCLPSGEFSDFFSLQLLVQLFVNTVDLESTIFLWDNLALEGSLALIKGVTSLVGISSSLVAKGDHPIKILKSFSENDVSAQLKKIYEDYTQEITETRVTRLRGQARDYRAQQWKTCERLVLKRLQKCSNFSEEEIKQLQIEFNKAMQIKKSQPKQQDQMVKRKTVYLPQPITKQMEETEGEAEIGFTKPEFMELIQKLSPGLLSSAEAMFDQFDEDKSGYLDFRELTICMSILSKGNFEDKLKICFGAYDADHSGYLQQREVQSLLENLLRPYANELVQTDSQDLKQTIDDVWKKMMTLSEKCNGVVSFNDFLYGIKADPVLYSVFCDNLGANDQKTEVKTIVKIMSKSSFAQKKIKDDRHGETRCKCILF